MAIQNINSEYNYISSTLHHIACTDVMWVGSVKQNREYDIGKVQ